MAYKSKEKFLEKNGKTWSYCHVDPKIGKPCTAHASHVSAKDVTKNLKAVADMIEDETIQDDAMDAFDEDANEEAGTSGKWKWFEGIGYAPNIDTEKFLDEIIVECQNELDLELAKRNTFIELGYSTPATNEDGFTTSGPWKWFDKVGYLPGIAAEKYLDAQVARRKRELDLALSHREKFNELHKNKS